MFVADKVVSVFVLSRIEMADKDRYDVVDQA